MIDDDGLLQVGRHLEESNFLNYVANPPLIKASFSLLHCSSVIIMWL